MNYDAMVAALRHGEWAKAEDLGRNAVAHYPRDAQLWELIGESFEHQNASTAAFWCYDRAWMLDPRATWVAAARQRLGAAWGDRQTPIPAWLQHALDVPRVRVVGAMIVRNEEDVLPQALHRLRPAVDELVVVDTGSTDRSPEISREAGARVIYHRWRDDFSAARNAATAALGSDGWVLWVDADEWLDGDDVLVPRTVAGLWDGEVVLARLVQVNWIGGRRDPNYDTTRFYPLGRGIHWTGRIHEQVMLPPGVIATSRPSVRIRVEHHGYEADVVQAKRKLERNIRILREVVEAQPDDVGSLGFLGRDLFVSGEWAEAIPVLERADAVAVDHPEYARQSEVRHVLIEAYLKAGRLADAAAVAERLVQEDPAFPGGWYLRGQVHLLRALDNLQVARESFEQAIGSAKRYRGIVSFHADIPSVLAPIGLADAAKFQGRWAEAWVRYDQVQKHEWNQSVANQQASMQAAWHSLREAMEKTNSDGHRE